MGGNETLSRYNRSRRSTYLVESKAIHHAKDELEFATNWRRVFTNIYQQLKWLNAYALINHIAMQKILKKAMKEHF